MRYGGLLLGSFSKTQVSIAQSTCEAELVAMNAVACELMGLKSLCEELGLQPETMLGSDSSSAVALTSRVGPGRLRHIETRKLWLQQQVEKKAIAITHVSGEQNVADLLTKALPGPRHRWLTQQLGLVVEGT